MPFEIPSAQALINKYFGSPSENHVLINMNDLVDLELEGKIVFYPAEGLETDTNVRIQTPNVPETRVTPAIQKQPQKTKRQNVSYDIQNEQNFAEVKADTQVIKHETKNWLGIVTRVTYETVDLQKRTKVPIIHDTFEVDPSKGTEGKPNEVEVTHGKKFFQIGRGRQKF